MCKTRKDEGDKPVINGDKKQQQIWRRRRIDDVNWLRIYFTKLAIKAVRKCVDKTWSFHWNQAELPYKKIVVRKKNSGFVLVFVLTISPVKFHRNCGTFGHQRIRIVCAFVTSIKTRIVWNATHRMGLEMGEL